MYRLDELKKLENERAQKIRRILNDGKKIHYSLNDIGEKKREMGRNVYNKNMVNMLYGRKERQSSSYFGV
jgi:hypothetical protein